MTTENESALATRPPATVAAPSAVFSVFASIESFELAQRMAKALSTSDMVPDNFKGDGKTGNLLIALELANRTGSSILAVMQNLDVIHGRPSWRATFVVAAINACGRFEPLRYDVQLGQKGTVEFTESAWTGPRDNRQRTNTTKRAEIQHKSCIAWTVPRGTRMPANVRTLADAIAVNLPVFEGPPVTMEMAVQEGWYGKADSKWKTMSDLMIRYRAAAFFGRLYAPEILMGMSTVEESEDMSREPYIDALPPDETPALVAPAAAGQPAAQQPARRGRPAGSTNRPKPADVAPAPTQEAATDAQAPEPVDEPATTVSAAGAEPVTSGTMSAEIDEVDKAIGEFFK